MENDSVRNDIKSSLQYHEKKFKKNLQIDMRRKAQNMLLLLQIHVQTKFNSRPFPRASASRRLCYLVCKSSLIYDQPPQMVEDSVRRLLGRQVVHHHDKVDAARVVSPMCPPQGKRTVNTTCTYLVIGSLKATKFLAPKAPIRSRGLSLASSLKTLAVCLGVEGRLLVV